MRLRTIRQRSNDVRTALFTTRIFESLSRRNLCRARQPGKRFCGAPLSLHDKKQRCGKPSSLIRVPCISQGRVQPLDAINRI